jgi:outer membrane protein W
MKKYISILCIVCSFITSLKAQEEGNNIVVTSWEIGVPTIDFVSKTSLAGGRIEYRHLLNDNVSVGGAISWSSFEELVTSQTYESPDGLTAVTTDMDRLIYALPITLNMHYYLDITDVVIPYAGINLGAQYSEQTIYYNIFSSHDENWGVALRPEVGVLFNLDSNVSPYVSAGYHFATNRNEAFKINNLQYATFNIGLAFVFE